MTEKKKTAKNAPVFPVRALASVFKGLQVPALFTVKTNFEGTEAYLLKQKELSVDNKISVRKQRKTLGKKNRKNRGRRRKKDD